MMYEGLLNSFLWVKSVCLTTVSIILQAVERLPTKAWVTPNFLFN